MISSNTAFAALLVVVCFGCSHAIQCFDCVDKTTNCISGIMISCPPSAQFCKLDWTAATDLTSQSCATSTDCPASSAVKKRQAGRSFVGPDGSTVRDISNCCNYDGCNCVGTQCDTIGASSIAATGSLVFVAIVFAALMM